MPLAIAIGSDHAGFNYKQAIIEHLESRGYAVQDFGTDSTDSCDYPQFVRPAAEAVARGEADRGIVLGGSGNGEAMVANKVRGVRCALCTSPKMAEMSRLHNDANALALGARYLDHDLALEILDTWLKTDYEGGRHQRRLDKMMKLIDY